MSQLKTSVGYSSMIRYIIIDHKTERFLKRVTKYGSAKRNSWVENSDEATLLTTGSAASAVLSSLLGKKYNRKLALENPDAFDMHWLKVGVKIDFEVDEDSANILRKLRDSKNIDNK